MSNKQEILVNGQDTSDGYHTFRELYHDRAILFSLICNDRPIISWKSKLHSDGTMFDGYFIVGINTPSGPATYHYAIEPYWDIFHVPEIEKAREWDGHTASEAIERLSGLESVVAFFGAHEHNKSVESGQEVRKMK